MIVNQVIQEEGFTKDIQHFLDPENPLQLFVSQLLASNQDVQKLCYGLWLLEQFSFSMVRFLSSQDLETYKDYLKWVENVYGKFGKEYREQFRIFLETLFEIKEIRQKKALKRMI